MPPERAPRRPLLWVADDSPAELARAERTLAAHGDVRTFADGSEVLEAIESDGAPDALILDWLMPGVSGLEACRFLRARPSTEHLGILLLTFHERLEDVVQGLEAGANDYVIKPFREVELVARVKALVRTQRLRERAERAEAAAQKLLGELPEALLVLDAQHRVAYANQEAEGALRKSAEQLVGQPVSQLLPGLSPRALTPGALGPLADVAIGEALYAPAVKPLALGSMVGTALSLRDVTVQRRAQRRRLDFYSIATHDLRSPLQAILLGLQLMRSGRRGELPPEQRTEVLRLERRVKELAAMVGNFLDLARLDASGIHVELGTVDLRTFVEDRTRDFEQLAEEKGLTLQVECGEGPLEVPGDAPRLGQVLTNLVSNSVKFTKPGGQVHLRVMREAPWVRVEVEDTGSGIPAESLPTLFDPYARAASHQGVEGTGLGLTIVREIVEAHGGSVGVQSTPGQGSTFWIRLPQA